MNRTKIVTLLLAVLVLVALGHHQLGQMTTQALNTPLVPYALAQGTPSASPSPSPSTSPTPTPSIGESCTPGFYKNHTSFINGGSCFSANSSTTVATVFGTGSGIDPCVSSLTLLQALSVPASFCGAGTLAQTELNLMRQAITAVLNATTSTPSACSAATGIINATNAAIASQDATVMAALQSFLETNINNDKIGRCAD
jgi:hypothetical protein